MPPHPTYASPRIIPARAGFTPSPRRGSRHIEDHPRSRGVYRKIVCSASHFGGSSPLARGLPIHPSADPYSRGIIPARAGFTPGSHFTIFDVLDHPRSRGVYSLDRGARSTSVGSSPLARGLLPAHLRPRRMRGIIPARAGFTAPPPSGWRGLSGSSPLARGLRGARRARSQRDRIIPARAGFTRGVTSSSTRSTDHPRSRGVYIANGFYRTRTQGSSPLARGLQSPGNHVGAS